MIYKGSRYTNTEMYSRDGVEVYTRRQMRNFNTQNAIKHVVIQSDTLSTMAHEYYGDAQLWWVILEANPSYTTVKDIKIGDVLVIPNRDEVLSNV